MAHSLSAKKRIRQSAKRQARNRARKVELKDSIKAYTAALAGGDIGKAEKALSVAASQLGQTAASRTIHKNTAARKRSRLALKLNAVRKAKAGGTAAAKA